jgi:hypothetical protein
MCLLALGLIRLCDGNCHHPDIKEASFGVKGFVSGERGESMRIVKGRSGNHENKND